MKFVRLPSGHVLNLENVVSMYVAGAGTGVVNIYTVGSGLSALQLDFGVDDAEAQAVIDEATQAFDISDF